MGQSLAWRGLIQLTIRNPAPVDARFIHDYWQDATESDLARLGELRRPEDATDFLREFCANPLDPSVAREDLKIWLVDGNRAGYSTLKAIAFGNHAQIHLHLARPYWRQGFGSVFFCLSAREFLSTYKVDSLYCQPAAGNAMPNGMLRKVGFPFLCAVDYQRSDGSILKQNRYQIHPLVIRTYLDAASDRFLISGAREGNR